MNISDYSSKKRAYLGAQNPYKVIEKRDVRYIGENVYELDGHEYSVSPLVASSIDRFIGLKRNQIKAVADASGDDGVKDYRNYIAMINSIVKPEKLALVADPSERRITSAIPLKKDPIPMEGFFDFAEMFANDNNLSFSAMTTGSDVTSGLEMILIPDTKNVISLGQDEDIMTNGFTLKWNLGIIELGNYYERLICSNGMTEKVFKEQGNISSLEEGEISKLLALPQEPFSQNGVGNFMEKAYDAMETRASLSELSYVSRILKANGVDEETSEDVIPLAADLRAYEDSGLDVKHFDIAQTKSSHSAWDIFNRLKFFASNNDVWAEDDNRRTSLMAASMTFLKKPRDIKEYVDIFA